MEEQTKEPGPCHCPKCEQREKQEEASEEFNLAILIALVPALTITFLSNAGLF